LDWPELVGPSRRTAPRVLCADRTTALAVVAMVASLAYEFGAFIADSISINHRPVSARGPRTAYVCRVHLPVMFQRVRWRTASVKKYVDLAFERINQNV